jgi:hypothetical protein
MDCKDSVFLFNLQNETAKSDNFNQIFALLQNMDYISLEHLAVSRKPCIFAAS